MTERTKEICRALGGWIVGWIAFKLVDNHIQHKQFMSNLQNDIVYQRKYGRLKTEL